MRLMPRILVAVLIATVILCVTASEARADEWHTLDLGKLFMPTESNDKWEPDKFDLKLKLAGFGQFLFQAIEDDRDTPPSTSYDQWSVSRFRFKGLMTADKNLSAFFQLDFAQDMVLMDAWAKWAANDYFSIKVGQSIIPFGWQMPVAPAKLLTITYGQAVTALSPVTGAFRDQGIWISGTFGKDQHTTCKTGFFYYDLSITNGSGRNLGPDDGHEAYGLRLGFRPINPGQKMEMKRVRYKRTGKIGTKLFPVGDKEKNMVDFGISYWQETEGDTGTDTQFQKGRFGFDFRVWIENFVCQGEFISTMSDDVDENGEYEASGFFIELAYKIATVKENPSEKQPAQYVQPALKFDMLMGEDEDLTLLPLGDQTVISLGANYYFSSQFVAQMFYEIRQEEEDLGDGPWHNDRLLFQVNVTF